MPCGKRPVVKKWDKPKKIPVIIPSRYEQNEASVKLHWRRVMRNLELSYQDEQFWDSQCDTVRNLVGPKIFYKIAKIFNLPLEATKYVPKVHETSSSADTLLFYKSISGAEHEHQEKFTISDYGSMSEEAEVPLPEETDSDALTDSVIPSIPDQRQKSSKKSLRSLTRMRSINASKSSKVLSKTFSNFLPKTPVMSYSSKSKSVKSEIFSSCESARSSDDLDVLCSIKPKRHRRDRNPHFDLLYCNESETDMIRWNSKYKQKIFEVSASDQFSKKAEIMTKKIALEFYEWWVGLGNLEFKSEIKRPEDIEVLFQVWFDEHASRGIKIHPKVLPCVLTSIAEFVGVPETACPEFLNRQIASDVHAETSPAHVLAFNTCLPQKMKHIPPRNNTKEQWGPVRIPEDLRTMACVWEEVQYLTSTKAFQKWLHQRPHLPMPECLKPLVHQGGAKKPLFVVPSDYLQRGVVTASTNKDLALPVSQFSLELKEVLSKLMNE